MYSLHVYVCVASRLWLRGRPSEDARRLRQIILPSFLSYYPKPSLALRSPYFPCFLRARERGHIHVLHQIVKPRKFSTAKNLKHNCMIVFVRVCLLCCLTALLGTSCRRSGRTGSERRHSWCTTRHSSPPAAAASPPMPTQRWAWQW